MFDHGVMATSLTGYSMPIFWWGLLLILLFSVQLGWTPVSGRISVQHYIEPTTGFLLIDSLLSGDKGAFWSTVPHLILPTIVLGTNPLAVVARMTRSAMLEVLGEDYIRTARAKGLPPFKVVGVHALRNALIPVVTVIGLQVGVLFTGAILTETIFSWPGVGKWLIEAINRRDYPVLQGGMLLLGAVVMLVNLLVDVTYGIINPRIRQALHAATWPTRPRRPRRPNGIAAGPLREFWIAFSANNGAVVGLAVVARCCWWRCSRRCWRRTCPTRPTAPRSSAPGLAGRRLVEYPAGHRRHRPGHPVAPDPWRAPVAVDRPGGRADIAGRRHRARPHRRLRARRARDRDHAADGHHPHPAQPAAGHRDRRHPRPRPDERDAGRGRGGAAALCAHHPRGGDRRSLEGLCHRRRISGAGTLRLMFSEVLPNCAAPLIVQASLGVSTAILDAAALGFLGLGAQPPSPEWGTMLADAREFVLRAWWVVTFPGLAILITVLAFNLLGDGLRDALDPKLKR